MESKTNTKPAVSIVIPCYNVQSYIREVLDSVLAQMLRNIEVICVNDGSTDETLSIIREYAEADSRIVVIDKPNGGYGHTMNVGMDAATGEYIGIVESDDYIPNDMYQRLYELAKLNDLDFIRSDFYKFWTEEDGTRTVLRERLTLKPEYYNTVLCPAENLDLFNLQMLNWTGIYKTSFIRDNNIKHNESPGASYQDNGFWFQTYCCARRIMAIDEPFYFYRQDNAQSSINQSNKVFCMLDEYEWIWNWLKSHPTLEKEFIEVFQYKKTHNAMFSFSLLAEEYQMDFLRRYSEEYREAQARGELNKALFCKEEWKQLCDIIEDPEAFCARYNRRKKRMKNYWEDLENAKARGVLPLVFFHIERDGIKETGAIAVRKVLRK